MWVEASANDLRDAVFTASGRTLEAQPVAESEPWEVTVWIDGEVNGPGTVRRLSDLLIDQVDRLIGVGTVRVLRAEPEPRLVLLPSNDRALIERSLYDL